MNLDEIREIVDFMKENGLVELDYSEKNTSIHLKLAVPFSTPSDMPCAEEEEEAPAEPTSVSAEDVKNAAVKAAAAVSESIKVGATGVADFIKAKREERAAAEEADPYEVPLEEAEEPEPFLEDEEPEVVLAEEPDAGEEPVSKVKLDTAAAKKAVKKTGEALYNTAKAAATIGKIGLHRGKSFFSDLLKRDSGANAVEPEEDLEEEERTEE